MPLRLRKPRDHSLTRDGAMSLAIVFSRAQLGVDAPLVTVEVHLSNGLPALSIVGLPETAVRESRERVRSALLHGGFEFPARRITVNLAPADLPKQGGRYDLAIAIGILASSGQIPDDALAEYEFVAELALGGGLRPVRGVLPGALASRNAGRRLICATDNAAEAVLAGSKHSLVAGHLLEICQHLRKLEPLAFPEKPTDQQHIAPDLPDLIDVRGQPRARRALEITAAGGHNLLLIGPPGTGKTLLASRLPGLLPPLSETEALESAAVLSVCGKPVNTQHWRTRPFRAPHHNASPAALVGGGSIPRPGEISLAHNGVLFLDELPEFQRRALDMLREPMESGSVTVSRAAKQTEFPARFQFVAAMNPCPCGFHGDKEHDCRCSLLQVQRYRSKISGPLLDRIDLHVEMARLPWRELEHDIGENSATVRSRVIAARAHQLARGQLNARLELADLNDACQLGKAENQLLDKVATHFRLSPRAIHRILRVARSIADLDGNNEVSTVHLQEACAYRCDAT
ncbi:AAA+ ATPase superfamily protein YifB/ComM, associated with DNA recombination [hydrothermal vent metagenome]|uniref:AAA+ ATPase superfamily protein YifB/ComM, associated with DNA recombination n=1 Tax=hydrothermal vent metagenome TaxID=652676 RepID=A0A3B0YM61_9ZZZZ